MHHTSGGRIKFTTSSPYIAVSVEHYENTHYLFYKIIRDKHSCIPIILLSFPRFDKRPEYLQFGKDTSERDLRVCNQIVLKTYLKALEEGDENIYYIDGATYNR